MRTLILVAGAALALAACHKTDQAANSANVDETLSADNMASNDVTAIDAVTGDDANMAADVTYNDVLPGNDSDSDVNATAPASGTPAPTPTHRHASPAPSATPANSASDDGTANTTNAE